MNAPSTFPDPGNPERNLGEFKIVGTGDPVITALLIESDRGRNFRLPGTEELLEQTIDGQSIEKKLIGIAKVGGVKVDPIPEQPERYATNRLALSENDYRLRREVIQPMMREAGMEVEEHPLADIGIFRGQYPEVTPLVLASHTDTVPDGDMYDGVYGVISAIESVKAMSEIGFKPYRDIIVLSYTGEESSRFGIACFGSRAIFHGLNTKELDSREKQELGGRSIREVLGEDGAKIASEPIFGEGKKFKKPFAVIELHVEQSDLLETNKVDIGLVESIAAPIRFSVKIGENIPLDHQPEEKEGKLYRYLEIGANGVAGHSGATPMGQDNRTDGLVLTSLALESILLSPDLRKNISIGDVQIGSTEVDSGAMNKIPGKTNTQIRISSDTNEGLGKISEEIQNILNDLNSSQHGGSNNDQLLLTLNDADETQEADKYFKPSEIIDRQKTALMLIKAVEEICSESKDGVVGTIGTIEVDDKGIINLSLDIRGFDKTSRESVVEEIQRIFTSYFKIFADVDFGDKLPGSADPIEMSAELINAAKSNGFKHQIGSMATMGSRAIHDAANSVSTDTHSGLLFVPSRGGIAHNPDAYTPPEALEKGARLFGVLAVSLSYVTVEYIMRRKT